MIIAAFTTYEECTALDSVPSHIASLCSSRMHYALLTLAVIHLTLLASVLAKILDPFDEPELQGEPANTKQLGWFCHGDHAYQVSGH